MRRSAARGGRLGSAESVSTVSFHLSRRRHCQPDAGRRYGSRTSDWGVGRQGDRVYLAGDDNAIAMVPEFGSVVLDGQERTVIRLRICRPGEAPPPAPALPPNPVPADTQLC